MENNERLNAVYVSVLCSKSTMTGLRGSANLAIEYNGSPGSIENVDVEDGSVRTSPIE